MKICLVFLYKITYIYLCYHHFMNKNLQMVYTYHNETKHATNRYARSLEYMDWATQPDLYRSYIDTKKYHFLCLFEIILELWSYLTTVIFRSYIIKFKCYRNRVLFRWYISWCFRTENSSYQSLYHFTIGRGLVVSRLTNKVPYQN